MTDILRVVSIKDPVDLWLKEASSVKGAKGQELPTEHRD